MAKEVITSKTCVKCGLCCIPPHDQDVFADLVESDVERLPKKYVRLHVVRPTAFTLFALMLDGQESPPALATKRLTIKDGPLKGYDLCACVALMGSPMQKVKCEIYKARPRVCHVAVKPGDKACREIRASYQRWKESGS